MANHDDKTVYVFSDVLDEVQKFKRLPTGKAYLFGQWTSSFNPVVHGIYRERIGSSNFKFESFPTSVEDVTTQLKNNFLLSHIGEVVVNGSSAERSQDLSRNAPGWLILKVSQTSNDLEALLYTGSIFRPFDCRIDVLRGENPFSLVQVKKNIVEYSHRREDYRLERREVGQYGHRGIEGRAGEGGFDHRDYRKPLTNTYVHPISGEMSNLAAMNQPRHEQLRTTPATGHVARVGNNFESGVEEAEINIRKEQWYASAEGQKKLKKLQEGVKDIASDCKVEMKREKDTHNVSFTFNYYGTEWELIFPSIFPSYLRLKKVEDSCTTSFIMKQKTRDILNKIKEEVKQNSFGRR